MAARTNEAALEILDQAIAVRRTQVPLEPPCPAAGPPPVNVHTEWDPLEEVIVGSIDHALAPDWHISLAAIAPANTREFWQRTSGRPFPSEIVDRARTELESLAEFFVREGIVVRRPTFSGPNVPFTTPCFTSSGSFHVAMPRDAMLAVGDAIIETPMAWRNRYFETFPFREILKDYFRRGARWWAGPKPMLSDDLYRRDHDVDAATFQSVITEFEPVFDAADFIRVGPDLIGQLSHVTNRSGVEWLRRALGPEYRVHVYEFDDATPMHIDTTIVPLAPGKVIVNPEWAERVPDFFRDWEVLTPPPPASSTLPLWMSSAWLSINTLMLDPHRILVEAHEAPLIAALRGWGFEPVPLPFRNFQAFGGSFHCATLDVRRAGTRVSYA